VHSCVPNLVAICQGVGTAAPIFQNLTKIAFFSAVFAPLGRHCISIKLKFGWLGVGVGVPRIFFKMRCVDDCSASFAATCNA